MSSIINLLTGKSKTYSKVLVEKIKDLTLDVDDIWISHDEVALFPSVLVKEVIEYKPH